MEDTTPVQPTVSPFLKRNEKISMPSGNTSTVRGSFLRKPREAVKSFFTPDTDTAPARITAQQKAVEPKPMRDVANYFFKPVEAEVRTPFAKKSFTTTGSRLTTDAFNLAARAPEEIFKGVARVFGANFAEWGGKEAIVPKALEGRLGDYGIEKTEDGREKFSTSGKPYVDGLYQSGYLDETGRVNPKKLPQAVGLAAITVVADAADIGMVKSLSSSLRNAVLKNSKLFKAYEKLGYNPAEFKTLPDGAVISPLSQKAQETTNRLYNKYKGELTPQANADLNELVDSINTIYKAETGNEVISNDKFRQFLNDVATEFGVKDISDIRRTPFGRERASQLGEGLDIAQGSKALPGQAPVPGQAPAFGLSVSPVGDVGKAGGQRGFFDVPDDGVAPRQTREIAPDGAKGAEVDNVTTEPLNNETKKYKTTVNIQDKDDLEYLGRILSQDQIADIKAGKMTNFRGMSYEELARVNIVSETPKTVAEQLLGKVKEVKLPSNLFYHGTNSENAKSIMQTGFKKGAELPENTFRGGGYGQMQNSVSFAETPKEASIFSSLSRDGEIVQAQLKDDAKVVSIEGVEDALDLENYSDYLKEQKVDAVYIGGGEKELVVINPQAIKPVKSQVEAGWKDLNTTPTVPTQKLPEKSQIITRPVRVQSLEESVNKFNDVEEFVKSNKKTPIIRGKVSPELQKSLDEAYTKIPREALPDIVSTNAKEFAKLTNRPFARKADEWFGVANTMDEVRLLNQEIPKEVRDAMAKHEFYKDMMDREVVTVPFVQFKGRSMRINAFNGKRTLDSITKLKEDYNIKSQEKTGADAFFNTEGKLTIYHEFGHNFDRVKSISDQKKWIEIAEKWSRENKTHSIQPLIDTTFGKRYHETFAEAFADYYGNDGKKLPDYVKKFFDEDMPRPQLDEAGLRKFYNEKKGIKEVKPVAKKPLTITKSEDAGVPKQGPRNMAQVEKVARDVSNYDDFVATLRGGENAVLPFYEEGVPVVVTNPNYDKVLFDIKSEGYPSLERYYNVARQKKPFTAKKISSLITDYSTKYKNRTKLETVTNRGALTESELNNILSDAKVIEAKKLRSIPADKIQLPANIMAMEEELIQYEYLISEGEVSLAQHPGKSLQKFISRKEGEFIELKNPDLAKTPAERAELLEKQERLFTATEKAFEGDAVLADQYDNPDIIKQQIADYKDQVKRLDDLKKQRKEKRTQYRQAKKMYITEERDRVAIQGIVSKEERLKALQEVEKILRKEGRDRKNKIEAIRDFFYITEGEMSDIIGNVDFRLISDKEFESLLETIEKKAYEIQERTVARAEVEYTIAQNELKRVENLQEAEGLSRNLGELTTDQLIKFNELLSKFERGDVFLGTREIQTLQKNTDLPDVKTQRQIIEEYISKRTGVPAHEVKQIVVKDLDKFRSATNLAQQNAFFDMMVQDAFAAKLQADITFAKVDQETQKLVTAARASRRQGIFKKIVEKVVPTDELIVEYLEEPTPEVKADIVKLMTKEELELAHYIQGKYQEMRDYLVSHKMLTGIRENYYTHRRRSFLEVWLKGNTSLEDFKYKSRLSRVADRFVGSFFRALKETVWDVHKLDEAFFKILNNKTGEILPLEKFFQYSMQRSGNLVPSKNVATAFLGYVRTFETKRALDNYMPKIESAARAIAPSETTEAGVLLDDSLERFVKEWVNTQKGRPIDLGVLVPGGIIDSSIRLGVAFTRFLYLSFRLSIQVAAPLGEQSATLINLGVKDWAVGVARANTKQGKMIARKYEGFVGKTIWDSLSDQSKDIGSKLVEVAFIGFGKASRDANIVHLLGSMTKEEFRSGEISLDKLATLKKDIGRWRSDDLLKSIVGATSPGMAVRQFKSWAIPIVSQTSQNLVNLGKLLAKKDFKGFAKSREARELLRAITLSVILLSVFGAGYQELKNKKNRTASEEFMFRMIGDALSFTAALNVTKLSNVVLVSYVNSTAKAFAALATALVTGEKDDEGRVKGAQAVKKSFIPKVLMKEPITKEESTLDTIAQEQRKQSADTRSQAESEYERLRALAKSDGEAAAQEAFAQLDTATQNKIVDIAKESKLTDTEKKIKALGVENGNRARYIYSKAMTMKTKEEKNAYVTDLIEKGIITNDVAVQIAKMIEDKAPAYEVDQETSKEEVLNTVTTYAKAIGTDPLTAFARIFTGQKIRRIDNGAIIVERMSYQKSQDFKKKRDADTSALKLDHTIPLQLGGSNTRNNLELVPTADWESYTPVENYLGNLLRDGKISKKQAQQLIADFKKGETTFEAIKEITN